MARSPIAKHGRDHHPNGHDPIPELIGGIRFNYPNDSGPGGYLEVTTHDHTTFVNDGANGIQISDSGGAGIGVNATGGNIGLNTIDSGDINLQTAGTVGGGVYVTSAGSSAFIQLQSAGWVEADGTVIQLNGSDVIELNSPGIVHTDFPSQLQIGTSETGGSTSKIYLGNAGGAIFIDETNGTTIHGGSFTLGGVSLPLIMEASGSYIQIQPYIQMVCYANGSTLPTPLTSNDLILYGYEHSPGNYSLWAMLGSNRTQLATS